MSHQALDWALRDPEVQEHVHGTQRAVLIVLAEHAQKGTGEVWTSVATIAAESGWKTTAVVDALRELETAKWIEPRGSRARARLRRLMTTADDAVSRHRHRASPCRDLAATLPSRGNEPEPEPTSPLSPRSEGTPRAGASAPEGAGEGEVEVEVERPRLRVVAGGAA